MNSSSISTHDLRSHSIDAKRDSESKSKWNPKWANTGSDKVFKTDSSGTKRPKRLGNNKPDHVLNQKLAHKTRLGRRQDPLAHDKEMASESDDSMSFESQASSSPHMEDDITYSFDAKGPASGSRILELALTKAVEKFEDNQTTKLVKDEYEILDIRDAGDEYSGPVAALVDDEDDFELV